MRIREYSDVVEYNERIEQEITNDTRCAWCESIFTPMIETLGSGKRVQSKRYSNCFTHAACDEEAMKYHE